MAIEVSGEPRSMTSSFLTKLTFSRIEFMHMVSRRNTVSSRPRLTNSELDGFRKRPMSASIREHVFMSSHTDLGFLQSWLHPNTRRQNWISRKKQCHE